MVMQMATGVMERIAGVRLVATDIDDTLLRGDKTISPRMRAALARAQAAGITVVLATARPPRTLREIAREVGISGLALACNGAIIYDLTNEAIIHHTPIPPEIAQAVIRRLRAALPEVTFACEAGLRFGCEPAYEQLRPYARQQGAWRADALALAAAPLTKLMALHPTLTGDALVAEIRAWAGAEVVCTHSGLPIAEISAAGVDKATGLAALCRRQDIPPAAVVACGDMPTDLPMLRWAGIGVAVANAHPDLLAEADIITARNDDDGVALVLEAILHTRGIEP
jgi:Cof subfamily protein (haloacid dehalogenase superfamily)